MDGPSAAASEPADSPERFGAFNDKYAATLRDHVDRPGEQGLRAAYELGRSARENDLSMLQLVGMHLEVRRDIVAERGIDRLVDMDAFLSTALAAFDASGSETDQPRGSAERDRLDWLRGLSDAYIAIASGASLDERVAEVCVQARRFLDAADARLRFGQQDERVERPVEGDEISAHLLGSAGLLTVTARPGWQWSEAERAALQQLAALISAPINDARRLELAQRSGQLGALLGGVSDPDEVLTHFLAEGVHQIGADHAVVRIFDSERDMEERGSVSAAMDTVARIGEPVIVNDGEGGERWAVLPLGSGIAQIGVLALRFDDPQPFDEVQQSFLADLSQRLAAALERSRAYASERAIRQDAEVVSARLRDLQGLASDLARAATRRRVAQVFLRRAVVSAGAASGLVAIYTSYPQADVLAATGSFRSDRWNDARALVRELQSPGRERADHGTVPVIEVATMGGALARELADAGIAQIAWQQLTSGEREIGLLVLAWSDLVESRVVDRDLLRAQVAMAGSTLQRAARYDVEHAIADTLQRSLLAIPPLSTDRIRWSVLYRAGSAGLAGGDWYDVVEIDEHRLVVVVGDIVGRGVDAAASMGQLRSATRALATQLGDPGAVVSALDQFAFKTGQGHYSSLAYVLLDTRGGTMSFSIAGHPPPIVRRPDGSPVVLDAGRGPLLGMRCTRTSATIDIEPGARVVLYTDGLVDRRGESIDVGIARLLDAVRTGPSSLDPQEACRDLIERLLPGGAGAADARDDVAIVVVDLAGEETVDPGDLDQPADDAGGGDHVE